MLEEPFSGFSDAGWLVLLIQAVCQLLAWLSLSYAHTTHARHKVLLSYASRFDCYFLGFR
jgi:hypothetical protein